MRCVFAIFLMVPFFLLSAEIEKKVIMCGLCKDNCTQLPTMRLSMEMCGDLFQDYEIIIYENNSIDGTKAYLQRWAEENGAVNVISEDFTKEELKALACHSEVFYRVEVIAYLRNKLLERVLSSEYDGFDYVIFADLDFDVLWPLEAMKAAMKSKRRWDALFANGISDATRDMFAFRDEDFPFGPEMIGRSWWVNVPGKKIYGNEPWHKVTSAFGGLGIYKRKALNGCRYSATVTPNLGKVIAKSMRGLKMRNPGLLEWREKELQKLTTIYTPESCHLAHDLDSGFTFGEGDVTWIYDYHGPVLYPFCCEHLTFHADMIENGYDKLYVVPNMFLLY